MRQVRACCGACPGRCRVSFGEATGKASGTPDKKPKPKKGKSPARLDEVPIGGTAWVKVKVKLYRWVGESCQVRPILSNGQEGGPEFLPSDVEVVG